MSGVSAPRPRTLNTPARMLSDAQIAAEERWLGQTWDDIRADEDGHGGSPGEGIWERLGEIEAEARRRSEA